MKQNINYWLDEFRVDGFRFDATHAITDRSRPHLLAELSELVHANDGFLVAEDERNAISVLEDSDQKGWNFDAAWADDFHHTIRVSQDHSRESYYVAYTGSAEEIAETIEHGWLYRGKHFPPANVARGTECRHLAPEKFVYCISNHDQIGNRPLADRFHQSISSEAYRAVSLFFCLLPYTPMIFMGQEWGASTPFHFFTDFEGDLGRRMAEHRRKEFERGLEVPPGRENEAVNPQSEAAFRNSKLRWEELEKDPHQSLYQLYRDSFLLRKKLHVNGNPARSHWKVRCETGVVIFEYIFAERQVQIHFAVTDSKDLQLPQGAILLRSRKGEQSNLPSPETVVIELPAR